MLLLLLLVVSPTTPYTIRVCTDKDCLLDGATDALAMTAILAPKDFKVEACGCLGPCGGGPNIQVKAADGKAVKDGRPGKSSYYLFKGVDSAKEAASVLSFVTGKNVGPGRLSGDMVTSTRGPLDLDRTTRIALQRLLYVAVALFLKTADERGTWDVAGGEVVENSYAAGAAAVFVASQFMGTGSKANGGPPENEIVALAKQVSAKSEKKF